MGVTEIFCEVYNTYGSGNGAELSQASHLGANLAQREGGETEKEWQFNIHRP